MNYQALCELYPALDALGFQIPERLDGAFKLQTFAPHALIHQKDTALEYVGILLEGSFRVIDELENGNLFMIEINDPISFTGEIALLSGYKVTSVTLETITECRIAFLPQESFDTWLNEDQRLLRYVTEKIALKLYRSSYRRGERLFYSTKYVVLRFILEEYAKAGEEKLVIRKTRQAICEELGVSVNSINRVLNLFRQEGLISITHGKVRMDRQQHHAAQATLRVYRSQNRNGMN